ncbi:hypothetical protein DFH06DRAFT_1422432 [Mycena polygramma]|nr:hypothetical protein DFH06DRAFT_1422432 [Mycena polygramma]
MMQSPRSILQPVLLPLRRDGPSAGSAAAITSTYTVFQRVCRLPSSSVLLIMKRGGVPGTTVQLATETAKLPGSRRLCFDFPEMSHWEFLHGANPGFGPARIRSADVHRLRRAEVGRRQRVVAAVGRGSQKLRALQAGGHDITLPVCVVLVYVFLGPAAAVPSSAVEPLFYILPEIIRWTLPGEQEQEGHINQLAVGIRAGWVARARAARVKDGIGHSLVGSSHSSSWVARATRAGKLLERLERLEPDSSRVHVETLLARVELGWIHSPGARTNSLLAYSKAQ